MLWGLASFNRGNGGTGTSTRGGIFAYHHLARASKDWTSLVPSASARERLGGVAHGTAAHCVPAQTTELCYGNLHLLNEPLSWGASGAVLPLAQRNHENVSLVEPAVINDAG
jgi:hypothetical protein